MAVTVVAEGGNEEARTTVLAELAEALRANPLLGYNNPTLSDKIHLKQLAFHRAKTRTKVFSGGTRAGKSQAGVADDLIQLLPRRLVPEHLLAYKRKDPPFKCRVVTPDLGHTMNEVLESLRHWCPPEALKGGSWETAFSKDKRILYLIEGSKVDFMSFETDLDKFGGVALDRLHYDEEPPGSKGEQIRKQGLRRLVDYQGDEIFTFTPEFGLSWTATAFWDERGPEIEERVWQNERLTIVRATTHDNPFVPRDELSESTLTEEEYKVKVLGEWFHLKGLVYAEFDPKEHLVPKPDTRHVKGLQTIVGIDPGYRTTAVAFIGFDKNNSALVYDELYLHKEAALPTEAARQIKLKLSQWGVKTSHFVIDPMATNASLTRSGENIEEAYRREGIPVIPANNKVEAGILEVKRRLQATHPALLVGSNCLNWQKERDRYRVDDKEDGKFAVVKTNDHLMDATRYALMERTWYQAPAPKHPSRPAYGENPLYEPPYRPSSPRPDYAPMGTYS